MTTLVLETDPVAVDVAVSETALVVHLADGRSLSVPLAWYPRLAHGTRRASELAIAGRRLRHRVARPG